MGAAGTTAELLVLDVGKTLSKLSAWSAQGELVARRTYANERPRADAYAALDAHGIADWLIEALRELSQTGPIHAIVPVGHGAGAALLRDGGLALPPMDYEQDIPEETLANYRAQRDPFIVTGSPALPQGLNLGAQLYWLQSLQPEAFSGATIVPWAQYWAWFLSGVAASEVSSLGCHTDLWRPAEDAFSPMALGLGWARMFAPIVVASRVLGPVRPELSAQTGLPPEVRIHCGVHDSNAALVAARAFPEISEGEATVLSTGTWFVSMRSPQSGFSMQSLPEDRDCLVNVDVAGRPVPSARFMGGREIETVIGIDTRRVDIKADQPKLLAAVPSVLDVGAILLPSLIDGSGPFPASKGEWIHEPSSWFERRAGACLYAALVADVALDLIGARETLLIEGRFAEAEVFVRALASLRPSTRVFISQAHNDVSYGALRLLDPELKPNAPLAPVVPLPHDLNAYRERWRALAKQREAFP